MENNRETREKISMKDVFAMIIAQYSVILPVVLIGFAIWGALIWFVVKVLMGG